MQCGVTSGRAGLPWPTTHWLVYTGLQGNDDQCQADSVMLSGRKGDTGHLPSSFGQVLSLWPSKLNKIISVIPCSQSLGHHLQHCLLYYEWVTVVAEVTQDHAHPQEGLADARDPAAPTLNTNITLHSQILMLHVSDPSMQWWWNAWINTNHKHLPSLWRHQQWAAATTQAMDIFYMVYHMYSV